MHNNALQVDIRCIRGLHTGTNMHNNALATTDAHNNSTYYSSPGISLLSWLWL